MPSSQVFGLYYYHKYHLVSLPLHNVRAQASIKELAAQVKLTQTYGNDAAFPIEATYSFPIPARASVCSFAMIKKDGTRVVGVVQEKQEARETYNTAVAQGKQTSLMEQQTPDVFRVSVGNIPPNERVKIELVYATELSEDEENDSVRFHLPVHIGARYGQAPLPPPRHSNNPFLAAPVSNNYGQTPVLVASKNPFLVASAVKTPFLTLSTSVEALAPISKISCPSHSVSTELGPDPTLPNFKDLPFSNYARVSLSSDSALDKDFVFTIKSAGLDTPRCVAELHPAHDTIAMGLALVPRFKLPDASCQEFVFLVDRSGSMEDGRIAAARKALVVMLRSLPHKDSLFQITSFGSFSRALWAAGSKPYNQETLEEATRHIDGMEADFAGTEIRGALQQCFAARKLDRPTNVFVLTDGEAWDLDAVLDSAKTAVAAAPENAALRVSVLGIGDSVSTAMCEGIARVGHGTCMFVSEKEASFTGKVARLLKAARTPPISNISVDWGRPLAEVGNAQPEDEFEMIEEADGAEQKILNIFDEAVDPLHVDDTPAPPPAPVALSPFPAVQQSPFKIRNLFPGVRLNVYAILQSKSIPKVVTLRGSTAQGAAIELSIPVTLSRLPNDPDAPPAIHALAARKIIQDLEDGQHGLIVANPDDPDLLARTVKGSVVRLGTTYSISSTHTSFVAVDEGTPISVRGTVPASLVAAPPGSSSSSLSPTPSRRRRGRPAPPPPPRASPTAPPAPEDRKEFEMVLLRAEAKPRSNARLAMMMGAAPPPPPIAPLSPDSVIQAVNIEAKRRIDARRATLMAHRFPSSTSTYSDDTWQQQPLPPPPPAPAPAPLRRDLSTYNYSAVSSLVMSAPRARHATLPSPPIAPPSSDSAIQADILRDVLQTSMHRRTIAVDDEEEAEAEDYWSGGSASEDEPDVPPQALLTSDPLEALARLQSFDGRFSLDIFTLVAMKTELQHVRALFPTGTDDTVIATVIAMAFLSTKLGADIEWDSWEGMYEKAKEYVLEALEGLGVDDSAVERLEAEVVRMLAW
ncbi:vault protein inter-alpha-trypsin domain-containing protein [Mycena latifolia]|nr:vault protein inter-alpha-trypsin domain-containing protein [Mycena latifolia]